MSLGGLSTAPVAKAGLALRIGTVKNSKNFFRVEDPARTMSAGAGNESTETMASSESDIDARDYAKGSPFGQS
jgi:hypothetical protein